MRQITAVATLCHELNKIFKGREEILKIYQQFHSNTVLKVYSYTIILYTRYNYFV